MACALPRDDGSDLYDCQVCLTYMMDKTPRSLSCLHTFCETCIKTLLGTCNNTIKCPTCRKVTRLDEDDVQSLPVNFILRNTKHMKQIIDEMELVVTDNSKSNKNPPVCDVCMTYKPLYKCNECVQVMCSSCSTKHGIVPQFQQHQVSKLVIYHLCDEHNANATYVCMKCARKLCMKCMLIDHLEHREYFKEISTGVAMFEKELNTITIQLDGMLSDLLNAEMSLLRKVTYTSEMKGQLHKAFTFHHKQCCEIKAKIEIIQTGHENYFEIFEKMTNSKETCRKTMESIKSITNNPEEDICGKYNSLKSEADETMATTKKTLSINFNLPLFGIESEPEEDNQQSRSEVYTLQVDKELINIPQSELICCVEQIAFVGNNVVLPSKLKPAHVVMLNADGKLLAKYYPMNLNEVVYGVNVYQNTMYIVQASGITLIPIYRQYSKKTSFIPIKISQHGKIGIINPVEIIIIDPTKGNVSVYNTISKESKVTVAKLKYPRHVTVTNNGLSYIITELNGDSVKIYNSDWTLCCNIEGLNRPAQTAVTEMGTLLIANEDSNRISHFTFDGKLISHVVKSMKDPVGLAYRFPYLWTCHYDGARIKCFKLEKKDKLLPDS